MNSNERGKRRGIKIIQYNLDGSQAKVWDSFISIKKELGLTHKRVLKSCKNGTVLNGFYWRHFDSIPIENEEWKPVIFNGNQITVSSLGRVQTLSGTITHGSKTTGGYLAVVINEITVVVHRLICMAFNPITNSEDYQVNPFALTSQCKGNFNKRNNVITNLEWVTQSENILHSISRNEDMKTIRPVAQLTQDGTLLAFYFTAKDAAKSVNTKVQNILSVCDGRRKTSNGYRWTYTTTY